MPFDSWHISSHKCSIVTLALSRTETLFFSRWPWFGLSRSPKVELNMPFYSRHIISYTCSVMTIALSRTETLFFSRWPWSGLSSSTKVELNMPFRFATYHFLYVFCSIYSAISHENPVFQQMTLIWPFKVTKGQTDYAIRFATYQFL